jgi:hypothetical protein
MKQPNWTIIIVVGLLVLGAVWFGYTQADEQKNKLAQQKFQAQQTQDKISAEAAAEQTAVDAAARANATAAANAAALSENQKQQLQNCLDETDRRAYSSFVAICSSDARVNGGNASSCTSSDAKNAIDFMYASYLRASLFQGVLTQYENNKTDCYKQ